MPTTASTHLDPELAWQQVLARDTQADGRFVYAVETTGIFCRPSCPSHRPSQRHVRFFLNPEDAMGAGYRACRRCHPAGPHAEAATVTSLCQYIEDRLDRMVTLRELGTHTGQSPFTIQRMFERVLGISPRQYQIERRAEHLRNALAPAPTVTDAVYQAGYASPSRMYERAGSTLGMHPQSFRRGGEGEVISYALTACPLGLVLVAMTERGVCHVAMGDTTPPLESSLRTRFPRAEIRAVEAGESIPLARAIESIVSSMTEHPTALDLPLDLRATAFQLRVWQALRAIPAGQTRSYSELAAELGHPRAVRAVAQACARNPVAIAIPCHRVIGRDGALTGYRWGTERKRKLLEWEKRGEANRPE